MIWAATYHHDELISFISVWYHMSCHTDFREAEILPIILQSFGWDDVSLKNMVLRTKCRTYQEEWCSSLLPRFYVDRNQPLTVFK